MNKHGAMQTGWLKIGNKWYYMNAGGVMQTGWRKIGGKWIKGYATVTAEAEKA